jgi:hypothetical protein
MIVINRAGLEAASCECYGAVVAEFARVLGTPARRNAARAGA